MRTKQCSYLSDATPTSQPCEKVSPMSPVDDLGSTAIQSYGAEVQ